MVPDFENLLLEWPLSLIRDVDIATIIPASRRYAAVNRALKKRVLVRLRRGIYLIGKPFQKNLPSCFQIAHSIYGPSYISFESALYYHQWIPEAVYSTMCATTKRAKEFNTPLGFFQYISVPDHLCYLGVQRVGSENEAFFIADPWRAVADHFYTHDRNWNRPEDLYQDMRIEMEDMLESDLTILQLLAEHYPSNRVRKFLSKILRRLTNGNKNN
jgi:hypothetical protein